MIFLFFQDFCLLLPLQIFQSERRVSGGAICAAQRKVKLHFCRTFLFGAAFGLPGILKLVPHQKFNLIFLFE